MIALAAGGLMKSGRAARRGQERALVATGLRADALAAVSQPPRLRLDIFRRKFNPYFANADDRPAWAVIAIHPDKRHRGHTDLHS